MAARPPTQIRDHRRRVRLVLVTLAFVAAVAAVTAVLVGRDSGDDGSRAAYRGSEPPSRIELPRFELSSYRGGRVASSDLRGRIVLLTLLDTQCTDACPILAGVVAGTLDRLTSDERAHVRAVAVTVDPAEDTPASVRRFLRAQRAEGRLDYLLGDERELRPLWTALQVLPSVDTGEDSMHSAPLRLYDRDGVWVATLHAGADLSESNLLHDIRVALAAGGETAN